jgi:hypothetical protein
MFGYVEWENPIWVSACPQSQWCLKQEKWYSPAGVVGWHCASEAGCIPAYQTGGALWLLEFG